MLNIFKVHRKISFKKLLISLSLSIGIGVFSFFFTMSAAKAYTRLILPSFAPWSWIFGSVWMTLYILMGIASYRIWMNGLYKPEVRGALKYYIIQLILNFLWSFIFFTLQRRGLALVEILIVLIIIIFMTIKFKKIDKTAEFLMVPYVIWISFATLLNLFIWVLNL